MPSRERVQQLIALVEKSQFVETIREFYAEDATMQSSRCAGEWKCLSRASRRCSIPSRRCGLFR